MEIAEVRVGNSDARNCEHNYLSSNAGWWIIHMMHLVNTVTPRP